MLFFLYLKVKKVNSHLHLTEIPGQLSVMSLHEVLGIGGKMTHIIYNK